MELCVANCGSVCADALCRATSTWMTASRVSPAECWTVETRLILLIWKMRVGSLLLLLVFPGWNGPTLQSTNTPSSRRRCCCLMNSGLAVRLKKFHRTCSPRHFTYRLCCLLLTYSFGATWERWKVKFATKQVAASRGNVDHHQRTNARMRQLC